jgi:hypothetical protein
MNLFLVIVRYFHVARTRFFATPFKTDAPLPVNADAILATTVATQSFKPIAANGVKAMNRRCRVKYGQTAASLIRKILKCLYECPASKSLRPPIPIADDNYGLR